MCYCRTIDLCFQTIRARPPSFLFVRIAAATSLGGCGSVGGSGVVIIVAGSAFEYSAFAAAALDGVVSSHHVVHGCFLLVALGWFGASLASVLGVAA